MSATIDRALWCPKPLRHLYDVPRSARRYGCECGAGLHEGETHEEALAAEAVESSTSCDCGGYTVDGEVLHDGLCDLSPWPEVRRR